MGELEIASFTESGTEISFENQSANDAHIMIFGGEEYTENVVPYGPFVMNSQEEIREAYRDFHAGKYGVIDYSE